MTPKRKILIVEDEAAMSKALLKKLENSGFDVSLAENGEEAMQELKEQMFDWILLDLLMPVKDGFAVLSEKKLTINAGTKVCVLTCMGQEESLQRARDLGADLCFIKSQTSLKEVMEAISA